MNHLQGRWFTWNFKPYFSEKYPQKIRSCLLELWLLKLLFYLPPRPQPINCFTFYKPIAPDKKGGIHMMIFFLFLHKNICCHTDQKHLTKALLMSTHIICFLWTIRKNISIFRPIKAPYLKLWNSKNSGPKLKNHLLIMDLKNAIMCLLPDASQRGSQVWKTTQKS